MAITLHYDKLAARSFPELVESYPDKELPKLTRSTVPVLAFWRDYRSRVPSLLRQLGAADGDSADLHFEFTVPSKPIAGTGRFNTPSQTDLMIFADDLVVAIEGKWRETRYRTLRAWLAARNTDNRRGVIDHWLTLIGQRVGASFAHGDFSDVVYQMIHRAASACHRQAGRVALVYQCFGPPGSDFRAYADDLRAFHQRLGHPESFRFYLYACALQPTEHFTKARGTMTMADAAAVRATAVRKAIIADELFRFSHVELIPIEQT